MTFKNSRVYKVAIFSYINPPGKSYKKLSLIGSVSFKKEPSSKKLIVLLLYAVFIVSIEQFHLKKKLIHATKFTPKLRRQYPLRFPKYHKVYVHKRNGD